MNLCGRPLTGTTSVRREHPCAVWQAERKAALALDDTVPVATAKRRVAFTLADNHPGGDLSRARLCVAGALQRWRGNGSGGAGALGRGDRRAGRAREAGRGARLCATAAGPGAQAPGGGLVEEVRARNGRDLHARERVGFVWV